MVSIEWEQPNKHLRIHKSTRPLKSFPKTGSNNTFEYDTIIYTKENEKYYQFCIETEYTPFIVTEKDGEQIYTKLYNIDSNLWIIKEDWRVGQRGKGYHYCPSINTQGKLFIVISKDSKKIHYRIELDVNSSIKDFDFHQLKSDFEGELWGLITSDKSKISASKSEVGNNLKKICFAENKQIDDFLSAFDKIVFNPKVELLPSQGSAKIEKVRPLIATYRKLAIQSSITVLPSKSVSENVDIYENRYLCLMLHRIYTIIKNNIINLNKQVAKLSADILLKNDRIKHLELPYIEVDAELLLIEINQTKHSLERWKKEWDSNKIVFLENYKDTHINFHYAKIEIVSRSEYQGIVSWWVNCWWRNENGKYNPKEYCVFEFGHDTMKVFSEGIGLAIEIAVSYEQVTIKTKKGERNKYFIKSVKSDSLKYGTSNQEKIIKKQQENYNKFEESNWRRQLNEQEKSERQNQIQTLQKDIVRLTVQQQNLSEFVAEQKQLVPQIEIKIGGVFFKSISWRSLKRSTPSMTFIQNFSYRNALNSYNQVLKSEGISFEVFELYEKSTNYGIREMPQVYELWCLVTVLKTLKEDFHLNYNLNDINRLLKVINPLTKNFDSEVCFNFTGNVKGRHAKLFYQKTLPNNKRPDYIIEISNEKSRINLVLDAKFKNYNYKKSLNHEVVSLYHKYNGNNDYVFILHPCGNLSWQEKSVKMTNHGGDWIHFESNNEKSSDLPFHRYGYITHLPGFSTNIKKVLGMGFEYLLEPNKNAKEGVSKDPKPQNDLFCFNCGGENVELTTLNRGENRFHYTSTCKSEDCGHQTHIDYCWNCFTTLYKHGYNWDYHKTSVWSPYDIHCPNCGRTVAEMPQKAE